MRMITFYNFNELKNECSSVILDNIKFMRPTITEADPNIYGIRFDEEFYINLFDLDDITKIYGIPKYDFNKPLNKIAEELIYKLYNDVMANRSQIGYCIKIERVNNLFIQKVNIKAFLEHEAEEYKKNTKAPKLHS